MPKCIGINNRNAICKRQVKSGSYCCFHIDQKRIKLYTRIDETWPSDSLINQNVQRLYHINLVMKALDIFRLEMQIMETSVFYNAINADYAKKRCLIFTVELFKLNVDVCYGQPFLDGLMDSCVRLLVKQPQLSDYTEHFKRKCLKSHRDQAQKKLRCFYFRHVNGLCFDIVEKIMELV
jgi:hypothetical protein